MTKKDLEKQIELLVKDDEISQQTIINQRQELERLKERIEDLSKINEEHRILNGELRKELQQKENIIKEVRENINKKLNVNSDYVDYDFGTELLRQELLEILDKGE